MRNNILFSITVTALSLWLPGSAPRLCAQSPTAFTYQGRLETSNGPANGLYDFRCQLYDGPSAPSSLVSSTITNSAVPVTNGLFVLHLDFGLAPFNGDERWLLITLRTNNDLNFSALSTRQRLAPAPYAIHARRATELAPGVNPIFTGTPSFSAPTGPPFNVGSNVKIPLLNADLLDGLDSSEFVRKLADGSVKLSLDSTVNRPHLSLEETQPGDYARLELRTPGNPIWHLAAGGAQNVVNFYNAVRGDVMSLSQDGELTVRGLGSETHLGFARSFLGLLTSIAVRGEANGILNTGVAGFSDSGTALRGSSPGGFAGSFEGAVRIDGNSSHEKPFLQLHETQDGDYARIQLQVAERPLWHISVGGGDNSLVFYNSAHSVVTSVSETGLLTTKVLTITGGADIAEPFKITETDLPKGSVVVIDEDNAGQLKLSQEPYDKRVAGIISGAGGVQPGLSLRQEGVVEGDQHVALSGRVYVRADASAGPIRPGDLLTTSAVPGHAMKVTDNARAQGAVLGKAMTGLSKDRGLVLVLVSLQ